MFKTVFLGTAKFGEPQKSCGDTDLECYGLGYHYSNWSVCKSWNVNCFICIL